MIEKREIVFILGAGASEVYGLPSSSALIEAAQSDRSEALRLALQTHLHQDVDRDLVRFQEMIEKAKPFSIDRFLETQPEADRIIGKALISHALLKCQTMDRLYGRRGDARDYVDRYYDNDWMRWLLEYMKADILEEFLVNKVRFITFNYDQSLDTLLTNALLARYRHVGIEDAKRRIQDRIVHVYAQIGTCAYERTDDLQHDHRIAEAIRRGIERIQIISEGDDVSRVREFQIAHRWLRTPNTMAR